MSGRHRSVQLRVTLLVLVPLVFLVGLFAYTTTTSVSSALALIRSNVMVDDLGQPVANLQVALTDERAQTSVFYARPAPAAPSAPAALDQAQAATDRAVASLTAATDSSSVRQSASAAGKRSIDALRASLAGLTPLRGKIANQSISGQQAFAAYNGMIAASYQVLEQAIREEGSSTAVLPGIAVIELAISNEYLQQESALLDGNFAAHAFPAKAYHAFVSLVGAHRLLYAQSYSYLDPADRASLNQDLNPQTAQALAMMEDRLIASNSPKSAPPVSAATWNRTVATVSSQIQKAVGQAETRLVSRARSQANAKVRDLYLVGGIGLAAVILSLLLSSWIAVRLARQLHGLRDSALEMADVRLPDIVQRLRAGEDVDVGAEVAPLQAGADEIGQVKAAFNTAQRTAVQAAVDEAKVRRGLNDVFRNLARRSQSLLERQMALLDALERRVMEPDDLEGLFRIDHLTTRMRRHAESLIVLAGESPRRVFRDPVPFVDVLRAAAAEVEDYTRIRVICRTSAALAGTAVADVIHMLAEFVENAATFSPSSTEVWITGGLVATGFAIDVEDRGPGMKDEAIAAANASLAQPPLFDLSGSDRLGLFVASRLARRHRIQVTLRRSPYGGVTAIVLIPEELVVSADQVSQTSAPSRALNKSLITAGRHHDRALDDPSVPELSQHHQEESVSGNGAGSPAFAVALPSGSLDSDGPSPGSPPIGLAEKKLPQRVRQAALAPQLRDKPTPAWSPRETASRSPETAGSAMSAFLGGWQRGLSEAGSEQAHETEAPRDGESR
jgi:signal transduction histidine kinase